MKRTVDGLSNINADLVDTVDLNVSGKATINEINIGELVIDSLQVNGVADLNGGLTTTTITAVTTNSTNVSTPNLTATTANITTLNLTNPLAVSMGGTGQSLLANVTVGKASDIVGGSTGQVLVQLNSGDTGFVTPGVASTVLTSNGVSSLPSFLPPSVGSVTGILPVLNGGTGVSTSTGSGSVVLSSTPTLVGPLANTLALSDITQSTSTSTGALTLLGGVGVAKNVFAGGRFVSTSGLNATTSLDGAIQTTGGISCVKNIFTDADITGRVLTSSSTLQATSTTSAAITTLGGIGCAKNVFVGGHVLVKNTTNATTTLDGAIQTDGGISVVKDVFVGENVSADVFTARDTTQATGPLTGSIISSGGISTQRNVYALEKVIATDFKLNSQANDLNFDMGTFVPFLQSDTPANDALIPTITYTTQQGYWQNCNQFTFIYLKLVWVIPTGMPAVKASVGAIPGTYFTDQSMTLSDSSVFYNVGSDTEHLQPYQLFADSVYSRWMLVGFRQFIGGMINTYKLYDGTAVGDMQSIVVNAVVCRTTI